jgi:hypothetical protein
MTVWMSRFTEHTPHRVDETANKSHCRAPPESLVHCEHRRRFGSWIRSAVGSCSKFGDGVLCVRMHTNCDFGKHGFMTRAETFAKCLMWYCAALGLAPLPYLAFGQRELISWCLIGFPSLIGLVFKMHEGSNAVPILVIGYALHIGLVAKAMSARNQAVSKIFYRIFCAILVADVCVAWFGPFFFLLVLRPGE